MKPPLLIVWIALSGIAVCSAQQRSRTPRPAAPRTGPAYMQRLKSFDETQFVTKAVLRNGLTVVVNEFRSTPVVTISTYAPAGVSDEPEDAPGISRLLLDMLGRGTAARAPGVMGREIAALGGEIDRETGYDYSRIEITVPAMQWKKALEIAADAFLNPKLDTEEMGRAIERIRLESARRLDCPADLLYDSLLDLGFTSRPGRSPFGVDTQTLSGLTPESPAKYYKALFPLSGTLLVISGDVNAPDILTDVVKYYDRPAAAAGKRAPSAAAHATPGFRYRELRGKVGGAQVLFGFHVPAPDAPDYAAVDVLRAMLGSGDGSTLAQRLREGKKIVNGVEARLIPSKDWGYLALRMELDPANIDKCELAAVTELEILRRADPDEDEVRRAIAQSEREFWIEQETTAGRAHMLARFESLGGWKKMDLYPTQLRQVKAADIHRVASKYLDYTNCALLELLPFTAEARGLQGETVLKSFQQLLEASVQQELDAREKETKPAFEAARASAFKFSEVRAGFLTASILRGPELFIREDHTLPLIHLGFFYPGGRLAETRENSGITALMLRSMLGATGDKSAGQVYRQLEIYGGRMYPVVEDDCFGFFFSVLSQNIDAALDLLGEVVTAPKFDDEYVARRRDLQLWRIRAAQDCDGRYAADLFEEAMFKGHAYGLRPDGSEASVKALSPQAVREWYKSTVERRKPVVVVIGDTQGTTLAGYFVRKFSGSRFQDTALPAEYAKTPETKATVEAQGGKRLSVVELGFAAPPEGDEDGPVVDMLCALLGGTGGRLREQLEETQALATGVTVEYQPRLRSGSVLATAFTTPQNEDRVLKIVADELRRVIDAPLLYKDYRSSMSAAIGRIQIAHQERFARILDVVANVLAGKGLQGALDYTARIQDVGQDDLPDIARRVFNTQKSVTVRLHGRTE